jgi:hypothetical protein
MKVKLGLSDNVTTVNTLNQALTSTEEILGNVGSAFSSLGDDAGNALSAVCNSL